MCCDDRWLWTVTSGRATISSCLLRRRRVTTAPHWLPMKAVNRKDRTARWRTHAIAMTSSSRQCWWERCASLALRATRCRLSVCGETAPRALRHLFSFRSASLIRCSWRPSSLSASCRRLTRLRCRCRGYSPLNRTWASTSIRPP